MSNRRRRSGKPIATQAPPAVSGDNPNAASPLGSGGEKIPAPAEGDGPAGSSPDADPARFLNGSGPR